MSVSVFAGNDCENEINMGNFNFAEVWAVLGINPISEQGTVGEIMSRQLAVKCRRYKMKESVKGTDPARNSVKQGNWIFCGRSEGYISDRVQQLLELAEANPEATIYWG